MRVRSYVYDSAERGPHSGNSAEAHGFSRAEEARTLRATIYRLTHDWLPNVVINIIKEWLLL